MPEQRTQAPVAPLPRGPRAEERPEAAYVPRMEPFIVPGYTDRSYRITASSGVGQFRKGEVVPGIYFDGRHQWNSRLISSDPKVTTALPELIEAHERVLRPYGQRGVEIGEQQAKDNIDRLLWNKHIEIYMGPSK